MAKALSQPLVEGTLTTDDSRLLGTPEYMSPEQVDMVGQDIDTRSDVYSLGVLLYVLLAGVLPFDSKELRESGIEHIRKVIRETDPKTPSTRLTRLRKDAKEVAVCRGTHVGALAKCLHRELEWIPLKAMRKERSERYRSAAELADDIENYLAHRPLVAGPPSRLYRAKKFVRRYQTSVVATAAVVLVAVVGAIVSVVFAIGQTKALDRQARALAENSAMAEFLRTSILEPFAAESLKPADIREIFDTAAAKLDTQFADYPLREASMRFAFGSTYMSQFGDYDTALVHLERALEIQKREPDGNPHVTMNWLGLTYMLMGRHQEAEEIFRGLLGSLEESYQQQGREPGDLYYAAKAHLGSVLRAVGRYDEAEPYMWEAVLHPWWPPGHWRERLYWGKIALLRIDQGRYVEARQIYADLLQAAQEAQAGSCWAIIAQLGRLDTLQGNLGEAQQQLEQALVGAQTELGEEHATTVHIKVSLGVLCTKRGLHPEAERLLNEASGNMRDRLDDDHPELLVTKRHLGVLRREQGRYPEAEEILNAVIEGQSVKLGPDHPACLESMHELAVLYLRQTRYSEAELLLLDAFRGRTTRLGPEHPHTVASLRELVRLYETWGRPEEAEKWRAKRLDD
ncbi:MAG: tetratricopeptide repeat protein [Sedimentisphaerales bacterium]|nr:tetratricopeptide repeat protein [Sedimentisphaerales bacterium]